MTDVNGCTSQLTATVTQPAAIVINGIVDAANCQGAADGAIDVTPTGGTGAYAYSWTGPGGFTASTQDISSLIAGAWRVTVVVAGAAQPKSTAAAEESDPREDDSQEHAGAHSAEDAALALLTDELGAQPMPSEQ